MAYGTSRSGQISCSSTTTRNAPPKRNGGNMATRGLSDEVPTSLGMRQLSFFGFCNVVNENAVTDAGGFVRFCELEGDESAVVTHDWIRCLIPWMVTVVGEPIHVTRAVERQLP